MSASFQCCDLSMEPKNQDKPYYEYCITPTCTNTSVTTPDKIFVRVPLVAER